MIRHLTPTNATVAFVALALIARAYTVGELATLWLMALAWAGGLVSGILIGCGAITRAD